MSTSTGGPMITGTGTGTGAQTRPGADTGNGTSTDAGAKERAQQAASTAADEGKHVAGVAAGEAKNVAAEAKDQARNLVSEARTQLQGQVDDQSRQQKDLLASTLGTFGDDLSAMAQNGSGLAADVAHQVADRVSSISRHLDAHEPRELLDDVRRFARQRPGTFLLGALAAGVVVGRLARGTKDAIEAAGGMPATAGTDRPRVTTAAPNNPSLGAGLGQPTQPPIQTGPETPESVIGYSSPPLGTGLPASPTDGSQGGPTALVTPRNPGSARRRRPRAGTTTGASVRSSAT